MHSCTSSYWYMATHTCMLSKLGFNRAWTKVMHNARMGTSFKVTDLLSTSRKDETYLCTPIHDRSRACPSPINRNPLTWNLPFMGAFSCFKACLYNQQQPCAHMVSCILACQRQRPHARHCLVLVILEEMAHLVVFALVMSIFEQMAHHVFEQMDHYVYH